LAISKERKQEIIREYADWLKQSKAVILTEYKGLPMSELDTLRRKMREMGGEFHIIKNTLGKLAIKEAGLSLPEKFFEDSTAISFAFDDPPAVAKMMTEYSKGSDFFKIKGGYLGTQVMNASQVKALADLPPLPIIRAQLLGVLMAPASRLVRTLAEPARQIASVLKAHSEQAAATGAS